MQYPQQDDFIIVRRSASVPTIAGQTGAFGLVGPGLDPKGIPFHTLEHATARGTEIALNSRVSLWDATDPEGAVLVVTFRR